MSPIAIQKLKDFEGLRLKPYTDTVGKLTIGWGRNLDDIGISYDEATMLLENDIGLAESMARANFSWYDSLNDARKDFIVMMIFNIGFGRLEGFKRMITAIKAADWATASNELLTSKWATQVGHNRANAMARVLELGHWA